MKNRDLKRNASGYPDPTAYVAITHADAEAERFKLLLKDIFRVCESRGFHLEERIVVRDTRSGRIWR